MCCYRRLVLIFFCLSHFLFSCVNQKTTISSNDSRRYFEDLSYIRESEKNFEKKEGIKESYPSKINLGINIEIDSILSIIKSEVGENIYTDGFTIQIYLGDDRDKAENTVEKLFELDSLIESKTVFTQPNYRVKTGKYLDRFEANYEFKKIKDEFPNAIVIPEKIKIN